VQAQGACGNETVLFRVGVGDERVNHEVAVEQVSVKGRSSMIVAGDGYIHMLESWLKRFLVVDVEGRHWVRWIER